MPSVKYRRELVWTRTSGLCEYHVRTRKAHNRSWAELFMLVRFNPRSDLFGNGVGWIASKDSFDDMKTFDTFEEAHIYVCSVFELQLDN